MPNTGDKQASEPSAWAMEKAKELWPAIEEWAETWDGSKVDDGKHVIIIATALDSARRMCVDDLTATHMAGYAAGAKAGYERGYKQGLRVGYERGNGITPEVDAACRKKPAMKPGKDTNGG